MTYIGKEPADAFTSFVKQDFSTSATTSYTLDHSVVNENELALFINFVRQEPTTAYTASGTTLTLTSATASTDDMYCVYLGKAIQTVNPPNGSVGTAQLAGDAVTEAKIADGAVESEHLNNNIISGQTALGAAPADTDEFLVSDAGTIKRVDYSYIKAVNTPAFSAHMAADQSSLSDNVWVKLTMETEFFDSDGKYNTSNQRFTPTVAGKYMFGANVYMDATNTIESSSLAFYKNGSRLLYKEEGLNNVNNQQLTGVITLDTDDYVELYMKVDVASGGTFQVNMDGTTSDNRTYWYGYKLIGV